MRLMFLLLLLLFLLVLCLLLFCLLLLLFCLLLLLFLWCNLNLAWARIQIELNYCCCCCYYQCFCTSASGHFVVVVIIIVFDVITWFSFLLFTVHIKIKKSIIITQILLFYKIIIMIQHKNHDIENITCIVYNIPII